ncbi:hypothetical protein [Salipiger abyssi]|nr:hypothetical protein [Salipiger abyssi]MBN9886284.1 hypothetical protein [Salipiger abyssi]
MKKLPYSAPQIRAHGKLEDLTHGASSGTKADAVFVINPGDPLPTFTFT